MVVVLNRRQAVGLLGSLGMPTAPSPFLAEPYLNLGDNPSDPTNLTVLFHARESAQKYIVSTAGQRVQTTAAGHVHAATLTNCRPGQKFHYQILRDGEPIFQATAQARPAKGQPFRAVLFGDSGNGANPALRAIAAQAEAQNPDVFIHLGDIAYEYGRSVEYRANFYPIYRFLRTRTSISIPGNHDIDPDDCGSFSDAYAWYRYWCQPKNGPGNNFSFEMGDVKWIMLDSNDRDRLRSLGDWLESDLKKTTTKWRIAAIHHPPFSSGSHHAAEQQSRWLCETFQRHNVDLVISGHDHNYQRTHPLFFTNPKAGLGHRVEGTLEIHPKGIPYLISGAAGATLIDGSDNPQPYSNIIRNIHSLSVLDVTANELNFRQLDADGREIDRLRLTK